MGVDLFFVLSGFLITGILAKEFNRSGDIHLRNFYVRRLLRLLPCLILTCVLYVGLNMLGGNPWPISHVLVALSYTANWVIAFDWMDLKGLSHCWSLAIEEQYYLIWPWVIIALERLNRNHLVKGLCLVILAIALALYRSALVQVWPVQRLHFGLDTHMDGLVLGSALFYLASSMARMKPTKAHFRLLSFLFAPMSAFVIAVIVMTITWQSPWMGRAGYTLVAIASAVLILDVVMSPSCLYRKILEAPFMQYTGRISYGLYLLHYPLFLAIDQAGIFTDDVVGALFKIGISFAAASLSFHWFESYFLRLKHRF
ncbi:MAG: hypothetical protein SynsKO_31420 [Synoicihabitans sp.]